MSACICDYDPPEFWTRSYPTARKRHRCYECAGFIEPSEQYERVVGKWDGRFDTYTTCQRCHDIRQWVQNNVPCFCWAHGNLDDDARGAVEDAWWRAPAETVGLRFGLRRRLRLRDKLNQTRRAA